VGNIAQWLFFTRVMSHLVLGMESIIGEKGWVVNLYFATIMVDTFMRKISAHLCFVFCHLISLKSISYVISIKGKNSKGSKC
jgi:hypothetical protein